MKKSVYSITLLDDLVREIDRRAYLSGTTRSGLINRLLAEQLGLSTPENRKQSIFSEMARLLSPDDGFLINDGGDSLFAVRSTIRFKYNPQIRYSVVIYPEGDECFGELRATLRTQNESLIAELDRFFAIWQRTEDLVFSRRLSQFGGGKFTRRLLNPKHTGNPQTLANSASAYIKVLHRALSEHFRLTPDINASADAIARLYNDYINQNNII